ncbi:phage tail terminator protein [Acinetobacter sp. ANC 4640]
MADFFLTRTEIAKKLEEISDFKKIYTPLNSSKITEGQQVTPSAHVNFVRIDVEATESKGKAVLLGKRWSVTIACSNAASQVDGSLVADQAGELLNKVILLLSGFKPTAAREAIEIVSVTEGVSASAMYLTAVFLSREFVR